MRVTLRKELSAVAVGRRVGVCVALALVLGACTQTRNDVKSAVGFIQEANSLAGRPDESGPFPSPFAADVQTSQTSEQPLLTAEERSAAYQQLKADGEASKRRAAAKKAELIRLSPF